MAGKNKFHEKMPSVLSASQIVVASLLFSPSLEYTSEIWFSELDFIVHISTKTWSYIPITMK